MTLEGKVAVVTGGGSGIGEAVCVRFAGEGARVAVLDLNEEMAKLTADVAGGGLAVRADVSSSDAVEAALEQVEAELGPVDVWVNNAGIAPRPHVERVTPRAEQQMAEAANGGITTARDIRSDPQLRDHGNVVWWTTCRCPPMPQHLSPTRPQADHVTSIVATGRSPGRKSACVRSSASESCRRRGSRSCDRDCRTVGRCSGSSAR